MINSVHDAIVACWEYDIPTHMHDAVIRYVVRHQPQGDFFMAVVSNDFMGAAGAADGFNRHALHRWASLVWNEFPAQSHGSREKVIAWCNVSSGDRETSKEGV